MVGPLPPGALTSTAAADRTFDIPTEECCFTGCCDRGKAFLLDQLDQRVDKDSHDQRPHP